MEKKRIWTMATIDKSQAYQGELRSKILERLKFGYTNSEIMEELNIPKGNRFYRTARDLRQEYNLGVPKRATCIPSRKICKSCIYLGAQSRGCDFYFWTNELRGCDAGTGCKRYKEGKSLHKVYKTRSRRRNTEDEA